MKDARIQAQEWLVKELRLLTEKTIAQEEKRKEKARKKNEAALSDYNSLDEIRDAYGFGFITEKKCEKLMELWEESNGSESESYGYKIEILQDLYAEAKQVLEDLKGVTA